MNLPAFVADYSVDLPMDRLMARWTQASPVYRIFKRRRDLQHRLELAPYFVVAPDGSVSRILEWSPWNSRTWRSI
jgi:hypothetical protein